MSKELATPIDTSQIGKPYNQCNSEEKFERRKTAVRLAILMRLKKDNNEEQELTVDKISKIVGVPRSDLFRWLKMEENDHGAGMVGYKMGPSKEKIREKLSKEDKYKLFIILQLYFPQEFEIMYAIWCRKAVQELIYVIFGVFYSLNSISKLMKRGNFVLRRPEKFSILRDDEKIDKYEKGFEDFANSAKKAGATIVWGDETHGQQDSTHSRGYSPKGRAAHVLDFATTSSHRVFTLFIAISFCGKMIFTLETENSKAPTFIRFLRELKKHIKGKIYFIVDNASIHHAKIVKQYIGSQRKIKLFYLPPYSPDINPVELFNNTIKTHLRSLPAMTKEELIDYTQKYMERKMEDKELIKSFFNSDRMKYIKDAMKVA